MASARHNENQCSAASLLAPTGPNAAHMRITSTSRVRGAPYELHLHDGGHHLAAHACPVSCCPSMVAAAPYLRRVPPGWYDDGEDPPPLSKPQVEYWPHPSEGSTSPSSSDDWDQSEQDGVEDAREEHDKKLAGQRATAAAAAVSPAPRWSSLQSQAFRPPSGVPPGWVDDVPFLPGKETDGALCSDSSSDAEHSDVWA